MCIFFFFFFNDPATTEIYTLSLHDALPIRPCADGHAHRLLRRVVLHRNDRSEEHTSELQSHSDLVCRLLLEKKKKKIRVTVEQLYTNTTNSTPQHSHANIIDIIT